jgi:fluoroquinolone transport system permease protein
VSESLSPASPQKKSLFTRLLEKKLGRPIGNATASKTYTSGSKTDYKTDKGQLKTMMKWDYLFLRRYGIIFISVVVLVIYSILFVAFEPMNSPSVIVLLLFSDFAVLGMTFIGALIYFEKNENVLPALSVTPMKPITYLMSKIITLSSLGLGISLFIVLIFQTSAANFLWLIIGIGLSSMLFTLIGIMMMTGITSFNQFMIRLIVMNLIIIVPLLDYLNLVDSFVFYLFPSQPALILADAIFTTRTPFDLVYSILYLLIAIKLCSIYALKLSEKMLKGL